MNEPPTFLDDSGIHIQHRNEVNKEQAGING